MFVLRVDSGFEGGSGMSVRMVMSCNRKNAVGEACPDVLSSCVGHRDLACRQGILKHLGGMVTR